MARTSGENCVTSLRYSALRCACFLIAVGILLASRAYAEAQWFTIERSDGPGQGKHIVFVTGDEEYRSEESMPQLAKILANRHGFRCTVLFAIDPKDGSIDPGKSHIPGLHLLETADLMVIFIRFRDLPLEQMRRIVDYANSGKPILGIRTSVAAFKIDEPTSNPYAKYDFRSSDFSGGFGRQVLGETWIRHHGVHQKESTRGHIAKGMEEHPIVRGCTDIWGPSDVYGVTSLSGDSKPLVMGQVLTGMNPSDSPNLEKDFMPVAWTKTYTGAKGKSSRVFTTTMGAGGDFKSQGFRRLLVNACYWCLGMEDAIEPQADVDIVGEYAPNPIGFNGHKAGLKVSDFRSTPTK